MEGIIANIIDRYISTLLDPLDTIAETTAEQLNEILGESNLTNDFPGSTSNSIIGVLGIISDIFATVDDPSSLFVSIKDTNLQLAYFIFQLLQTDHSVINNIIGIVNIININVLTIILPFTDLLGLIFGFDIDSISSFFLSTLQSSQVQNSQSNALQLESSIDNPSLQILIANTLIMVLGAVSELISYFKAGKSSAVKSILDLVQLSMSFISFNASNIKSNVINEYYPKVPYENQPNNFFTAIFDYILGFQKENIIVRLVTSSLSLIRDVTNLIIETVEKLIPTTDLSGLSDLVTILTYYVEMLIKFMKANIDYNRISLDRSIPEVVLFDFNGIDSIGVGYILSLVENMAKGIIAIIKGGDLKSIDISSEKKIRIAFSLFDIVEDFLVVIYPDIIRYN